MAIDKVGLSEKEETIGRLYALRAGLSVVAQEKETADGIMQRAYKDKQAIADRSDKIVEAAEREVDAKVAECNGIENQIPALSEKANSSLTKYKILNILANIGILIGVSMIIFTALFYIFCMIGYYSKFNDSNHILGKIFGWSPAEISWLYFCGGIGLIVLMKAFRETIKEKYYICSREQKEQAQETLAENYARIKELQKEIESAEDDVASAKKKRDENMRDVDIHITKQKEKATEHAVAGLVMINALEDSFSDMIDPRDWENTDILIYALETRRAENMKEALQVVDGERRTERIVEAVNTAGQEICKSINTGLRRLQGEMTRCFGILGQLVVLQGDRIAGHVQNLSDCIAANNSYMAQLTSQQSMTNALMAKANENSAAIAAEVNRLRTGTEYAQARYLYGTK